MITDDNESEIPYALNAAGRMVHVDSVPNGKECNCRCPKCNQPMMAKQGEKRKHHFAHMGEYSTHSPHECRGYYEAMMHLLSKQIINEEKQLMLPAYEDVVPPQKIVFETVEVEERKDSKDLQPDLVGETLDGRRIHIEICYSHKVPETKRQKLRERKIECLEIYVRGIEPERLSFFLLNKTENRTWLNYPEGERLKLEKEAEKDAILKKRLEEDKQNKEILAKWNLEREAAETKRKQEEQKIVEEEKRLALVEAQRKEQEKIQQQKENIKKLKSIRKKEIKEWEQSSKISDKKYHNYYHYRISSNPLSFEELHLALDSLRHTLNPFITIDGYETKIIWLEVSTEHDCIYILHANKGCYGSRPFHLTCAMLMNNRDYYKNLGSYTSEHIATMAYLKIKNM